MRAPKPTMPRSWRGNKSPRRNAAKSSRTDASWTTSASGIASGNSTPRPAGNGTLRSVKKTTTPAEAAVSSAAACTVACPGTRATTLTTARQMGARGARAAPVEGVAVVVAVVAAGVHPVGREEIEHPLATRPRRRPRRARHPKCLSLITKLISLLCRQERSQRRPRLSHP